MVGTTWVTWFNGFTMGILLFASDPPVERDPKKGEHSTNAWGKSYSSQIWSWWLSLLPVSPPVLDWNARAVSRLLTAVRGWAQSWGLKNWTLGGFRGRLPVRHTYHVWTMQMHFTLPWASWTSQPLQVTREPFKACAILFMKDGQHRLQPELESRPFWKHLC